MQAAVEEGVEYHRGSQANSKVFKERLKRASRLMEKAGLDAILLTKPQNMMYLVRGGRLCAFSISGKKRRHLRGCAQDRP